MYLVLVSVVTALSAGTLDLHVVVPDAAHHRAAITADGSRARPFTSVHDANDALRACGGCAATVSLHPGTHVLGARGTLRLSDDGGAHKSSKQLWQGLVGPNGERALLSGGAQVTGPWTEVAAGQWSAALPPPAPLPKTLRIGIARAEQATFPSAADGVHQRWLFLESVQKVAPGPQLNNRSYEISVQKAASNVEKANCSSWGQHTPGALVAYVFPANSWVGLRVVATPIAGPGGKFTLLCPDGTAGLQKGNRIAFAGALEILTSSKGSGVWAAEGRNVHILAPAAPTEGVWVPVHRAIVIIAETENVEMSNITFVDADFIATGVQTGFNEKSSDAGCPHDGAVVISNATNVTLRACNFLGLSGGGVIVGNTSTEVAVLDSNFSEIGQSGVMFIGNDTTQPRGAVVEGNTMVGIGTILASAGGVLITSGSSITVRRNNISECSRWGVALRSNHNATSEFNVIEENRVVRTGLVTADFGAISMIDHSGGHAQGNVVRGNCVRDVRGMRDQMFHGKPAALLTSFWGRGLYLDDHTSNVEVSHNVFVDTSHAAIFFHSGSNNSVWNNVFANSTYNRGSVASTQLLFKEITHGTRGAKMANNRLFRNVMWTPRDVQEPRPGDVSLLGGSTAGALSVSNGGGTHHNWYYRRGKTIGRNVKTLLFQHDWTSWIAKRATTGRGNGSVVNKDPMFVDAQAGNWNLEEDSPLKDAIGWEDLPLPMC